MADDTGGFSLRPAVLCDVVVLVALHADALRHLSSAYYDKRQIEAGLRHIGTLDPALIDAGTYFVAVSDDEIIGCGGWMPAGQLVGCGKPNGNDIGAGTNAAAIRSVFVSPAHAGKGIASVIMKHTEAHARAAGYDVFELLSTLNAMTFYVRHQYRPVQAENIEMPGGLILPAIKMLKQGARAA